MSAFNFSAAPNYLILDTAPLVHALEQRLTGLSIYSEFTMYEIVDDVFSYICDRDSAYGHICEYAIDFTDRYINNYPQSELDALTNNIIRFGTDVVDMLVRLGVYDNAGYFWYELHSFISYDVKMEKVNPENF